MVVVEEAGESGGVWSLYWLKAAAATAAVLLLLLLVLVVVVVVVVVVVAAAVAVTDRRAFKLQASSRTEGNEATET